MRRPSPLAIVIALVLWAGGAFLFIYGLVGVSDWLHDEHRWLWDLLLPVVAGAGLLSLARGIAGSD